MKDEEFKIIYKKKTTKDWEFLTVTNFWSRLEIGVQWDPKMTKIGLGYIIFVFMDVSK